MESFSSVFSFSEYDCGVESLGREELHGCNYEKKSDIEKFQTHCHTSTHHVVKEMLFLPLGIIIVLNFAVVQLL